MSEIDIHKRVLSEIGLKIENNILRKKNSYSCGENTTNKSINKDSKDDDKNNKDENNNKNDKEGVNYDKKLQIVNEAKNKFITCLELYATYLNELDKIASEDNENDYDNTNFNNLIEFYEEQKKIEIVIEKDNDFLENVKEHLDKIEELSSSLLEQIRKNEDELNQIIESSNSSIDKGQSSYDISSEEKEEFEF